MRKTFLLLMIALVATLATMLLLVNISAAKPPAQPTITHVEPDTLASETGGTLSIYGSGFTTTTIARLVSYGLLNTTYVNATALQAVVPPGVPAGTYDLEVTDGISKTILPDALTIVNATPIPTAKPAPTPKPPPAPGRPILTIRSYSVQPARPAVGSEFVVTVEIYNNGSRGGENTIVTFPGGTFLPVGNSGHLLGLLHINHTAVVTQTMRVPSGLSSGTYDLRVNLGANDFEGNHYDYPETVAVEVIGVGHGRPQLVIETAQTEPTVLGPGDGFNLTLRLTNHGSRTATGVLIGAASPDLALPAGGSNVVSTEAVGINQTVTATLPLVLGEVTQAGRLSLNIALNYTDYTGGSYTDQQNVGLEVSTALADRPQLIIAGYHTVPGSLAPGDVFTLTLEITNVGGGDAQRLTLTLGGGTTSDGKGGMGPFAPLQSGNVKFLPKLPAGETVEVTQQLIVNGSADPGAYSVPVALAFDDSRGTRHTDSQLISLLVRRQPHLQIGFYRPLEMAVVGIPFQLPVEVTNLGRSLVNASMLEITSEQLEVQDGSFYLGALDGGTSGSWEAIAIAQAGGAAEILVSVHYLDDFDQPQVVTKTLTVEVEEPMMEAGPESGPAPAEEQAETFWDQVLRFLKGMLGLGS